MHVHLLRLLSCLIINTAINSLCSLLIMFLLSIRVILVSAY
nr:MAG TPA: hypothetical protein [Caudoviricetes sp.]